MSKEHSPLAALRQAIEDGTFEYRKPVLTHIADCMYSDQDATPERAKAWIQSPEKAKREKLAGMLTLALHKIVTPQVETAMEKADGPPGWYVMNVGFVGVNAEVVSPVKYRKPRTLKINTDSWESQAPLRSSALNSHKDGKSELDDPRIHSSAARKVRAWHLDEIAQAVPLAKGDMALVGPRGYTPPERKDLELVFELFRLFPELIPKNFPTCNYQGLMSDVRPKPGIAGLYAEYKKNMTLLERLWSDVMYMLMATKKNDDLLFVATVRAIFFSRNGGSR